MSKSKTPNLHVLPPPIGRNAGAAIRMLEAAADVAKDPTQNVTGVCILMFRAGATYQTWWSAAHAEDVAGRLGVLEMVKFDLLQMLVSKSESDPPR